MNPKEKHINVSELQKFFFSMQPLRFLFSAVKEIPFDTDLQQDILNKTINSELQIKYPVSKRYMIAFLNRLIEKCENTGDEIIDELYETYTNYISVPLEHEEYFYKTYILPSGKTISIAVTSEFVLHGTTGTTIWPATLGLNEWIYQNKSIFDNKSVLELGAGVGLCGIFTCLECEPMRYIFSDCHDLVLQRLQHNVLVNLNDYDCYNIAVKGLSNGIIRNGIKKTSKKKVEIMALDWHYASDYDFSSLQSDIILAADVAYDIEILCSLVNVLERLLRHTDSNKAVQEPVAYISSTIRSEDTYNFFLEKLDAHGIHHEDVDFVPKGDCFISLDHNSIKIVKLWMSSSINGISIQE